MANHKSAKKRIRQNSKRKLRNKSYLSKLKSAVRNFRKIVTGEDSTQEAINSALVACQSLFGKATSKGMVHRNNSSRCVSRLAKLASKATAKSA